MTRKELRNRFHAGLVHGLFALSTALPIDTASSIGSFLARRFGPRIAPSAHKSAIRNLKMIYPDMPEAERDVLLGKIWDNLGRNAAELPHLRGDGLFKRLHVTGLENLPAKGSPCIFISGHYGNWELTYPMAHDNGVPTALIYRHANNERVDKIICDIRSGHCVAQFPKGGRGAVRLAHAIKRGESLAMLVDQKMNDGIAVPFFGIDAMTAPAVATLAMRFGLPIIPARVIRKGGAHFEGIIYPPLQYVVTGDQQADELAIMTQINLMLEGWIREHPEQWFWVHRRWPKEVV